MLQTPAAAFTPTGIPNGKPGTPTKPIRTRNVVGQTVIVAGFLGNVPVDKINWYRVIGNRRRQISPGKKCVCLLTMLTHLIWFVFLYKIGYTPEDELFLQQNLISDTRLSRRENTFSWWWKKSQKQIEDNMFWSSGPNKEKPLLLTTSWELREPVSKFDYQLYNYCPIYCILYHCMSVCLWFWNCLKFSDLVKSSMVNHRTVTDWLLDFH